jgi:cell division protein FtsN
MAKRKARKAGRSPSRVRKTNGLPGWIYMVMGLAIGLAVAAAVYVNDRKQLERQISSPAPQQEPASSIPETVEDAAEDTTTPSVTFDFYEMLPSLDVEIYEEEKRPVRAASPPPVTTVTKSGIYILQAGSFSRLEDANRRKAEMGLLGVRSDIKKGTANGKTVYRVYTNPMEQTADVNATSKLLTNAGIEIMLKRVSD